jgi:hypothetical protein
MRSNLFSGGRVKRMFQQFQTTLKLIIEYELLN